MTIGFFKSIFLHLGILLVFFYGAEIFKKNKRFEIYEIPMEIVDISNQTVNEVKKKNKSISKKNKKNDLFTPPKPKSKPKPPEFSSKKPKKSEANLNEKVVKKPSDKKNEKKRMESILKSIEKIKSQAVSKVEEKKDNEKEKIDDEKEEEKNVSLGEKLTISEKDAIRRQFYKCWIVPAGAKNLKDLVVSIKIKLDRDGNVISSKLMNKINSDPFFRTASESALRAVNHPECQKLKVPKKKYETWKALILEFDPSKSLN